MWKETIGKELGVSLEDLHEEIPKSVEYVLISTYLYLYCSNRQNLNVVDNIRENDWVFMDHYKLSMRWDHYDNTPKIRFNIGIAKSFYSNYNSIKINNTYRNLAVTFNDQIYCTVPYDVYQKKLRILGFINSNLIDKLKKFQ